MARPKSNVVYQNDGRVVLVTGAGQGIGHAIAEAFQASGATVVAADIAPGRLASPPPRIHFEHCDTGVKDDCQRVVKATWDQYGGIDVLVNNAAIQPPESYLAVDELDDDLYQRMLNVNLSGYTYMAKFALRCMKEQGSGVVINVASEQGHRTARGVPVYGPIKAANIHQARQWAVDYARDGIRVVSISPGAIRTPLVEASLAEQGGEAQLANRHPLGRIGDPQEVSHAVLWLASDHASFVTGTDLAVDGGLGAFGAFADPY